MQTEKHILTRDEMSIVKNNKLYGQKGEEVTVIAKHGDVWIVENVVGWRFPIRVKSEGAPVEEKKELETPIKVPALKPTKRKSPDPSVSLFDQQ